MTITWPPADELRVVGMTGVPVSGAAGTKSPIFLHRGRYSVVSGDGASFSFYDEEEMSGHEAQMLCRRTTQEWERVHGGVVLYATLEFLGALADDDALDWEELKFDQRARVPVTYLAYDAAAKRLSGWGEQLLFWSRQYLRIARAADGEDRTRAALRAQRVAQRARFCARSREASALGLREQVFACSGAALRLAGKSAETLLHDAGLDFSHEVVARIAREVETLSGKGADP